MSFRGQLECHLTLPAEAPLDRLIGAIGSQPGLRFVHIELDRGARPSQPMLTRDVTGTYEDALAATQALRQELAVHECPVVRTKIECHPANEDVPITDAEAAAEPAGRYFEHHVKILITGKADAARAAAVAGNHLARLSRNARRLRQDGAEERFVSQRCRSMGRESASKKLDSLRSALVASGFDVLESVQEYVVWDSHEALDAGWLEEPRHVQ